MRRTGLGLRRKLTLWNVASAGGGLVLAGLAFFLLDQRAVDESARTQLELRADFLAHQLSPAVAFGDLDASESILDQALGLDDISGATLLDPSGQELVGLGKTSGRSARRDLYAGDEWVGTLVLSADPGFLAARQLKFAGILGGVLLLALGASFSVTYVLQRRLVRRFTRISRVVHSVAEERDYSVRVDDPEDDELGQFVRAFDVMLEQIQKRDAALQAAHDDLELHVEERTHALREEIARRAAMEEELIQSRDAAEAATHAKTEFVANISHEIRTPLIGVIGMADLLSDTDLDEDQAQFTQTLRRSGGHLLTLVNDILDYSRLEAGGLELESVEFDLSDLAYDLMELMAVQAVDKDLELLVDVAPDVPSPAIGDPARLRQLLTNLLGNALKFTESGHVALVVTMGSEGFVHFSVEDTGIGIPRNKLGAIFEKFTQADASTTRRYGGSGLGLAITNQLVAAMGGLIDVESEVGEGTRFVLRLPLGAPASPDARPPLAGRRAALLIPDARGRDILERRLRALGMDVAPSPTDSEDLIDHLVRERQAVPPIDTLFVEFAGKARHARAMLRRVRLTPQLADLTIIVAGDVSSTAFLRRELREEADFVLTRPLRPSVVVHALEQPVGAEIDKPRVLLVTGHPTTREVAVSTLEQLGAHVDVESDGGVAVDRAGEGNYDLVLIDAQLREPDAFDTARRLRAVSQSTLLALSSHTLEEERSINAGMDGILRKPLRRDALRTALERTQRSPHVVG